MTDAVAPLFGVLDGAVALVAVQHAVFELFPCDHALYKERSGRACQKTSQVANAWSQSRTVPFDQRCISESLELH